MANKYTFQMVVAGVIKYAKLNIADLAVKELDNKDKKLQLDKAILSYLVPLLATVKMGWVTKFIVEKFIIKNIPVLTQAIYDLLKDRVKGVTV